MQNISQKWVDVLGHQNLFDKFHIVEIPKKNWTRGKSGVKKEIVIANINKNEWMNDLTSLKFMDI